VVVLVQEIL